MSSNTQTIRLDKIGSALKNIGLKKSAEITISIIPRSGTAIAVRVISSSKTYAKLELRTGRMSSIRRGEIIAGVLGERRALAGVVGYVPKTIDTKDTLHILNIAGVIGLAVSWNKEFVEKPIRVKPLGTLLLDGKPINTDSFSHKFVTNGVIKTPLVIVIGTAMNVGKTTVATEVIRILAKQRKLHVAAAKLTGVVAQRDILSMADAGARETTTFQDVGLISTINSRNIVGATKTILHTLTKDNPDVLVAELGDGILGWYGVDRLIADPEFRRSITCTIVCANDITGAVGAYDLLKKHRIRVDFFAGPVTNNTAGTDYLERKLGVAAEDVRDSQEKLTQALIEKITVHRNS